MFYDEWLDEARLKQWASSINQRAGAAPLDAAALRGLLLESAARCAWCGADLRRQHLEIDHIQPLSSGGAHALSNLAVSCQDCNRRKAAKHPARFAQEQAARGQRTALVLRLLAAYGLEARTQRGLFDEGPVAPSPAADTDADGELPPYVW